jgi:drug/metabolite transporter (DMT)-like permease
VTTSRRLAYLALTVNAIVWGSAFPLIKPAFAYINPTQYLYYRFLLAGVLALPIFLYFTIKLRPKLSYIIKVLLIELLGTAFPLIILYEGLSKTSALEASLIGSIGPIFIVLGSVLFLREKESKREWQGLALSLTGSLILILEPVVNGHTLIGSSLIGNLYVLGYAVLYTAYVLIAKKVYRKKPPLYLGSLTYLGTALIYGLILSRTSTLPPLSLLLTNSNVLLAVLYMAVPGGILAFALYLYAQSKIEVSEANLFTYLQGAVAIPAAFLILGERPSWITITAILIIALGVYRAETRAK